MNNNKTLYFFLLTMIVNFSAFSMDADAIRVRAQVKKRHSLGFRKEAVSLVGKTSCMASAAYFASLYLPEGLAPMTGMGMLYMVKDKVFEVASACGLSEDTENMRLAKRLNELEMNYELQKNSILPFNQGEIGRLIFESRKNIGYGLRQVYNKMEADHFLFKVENILKLPTDPSPVLSDSKLDETLEKLEEHLSTYSDQVHDEIIAAAIKINNLAQSNPLEDDVLEAAKASFWFVGEAGVGKTETAEMLARALERPFCKLNLATVPVENLLGKASQVSYRGEIGEIGMLAKCFITPDFGKASIDPIIFIDEVHDVLNANNENASKLYMLLKLITEGRETEIRENSLGIKLNISRTVFIFGSNAKVSKDVAGALATRVNTILFDNISQEQKREIAHRHFARISTLHRFKVSSADKKIIAQIVAQDISPGARVLINVIEDYIIHRQACNRRALRCTRFNIARAIEKHGGVVGKRE